MVELESKVNLSPENMKEVKIEPLEMFQVKMEPDDFNLGTEPQDLKGSVDKQLPFVCDGILYKELENEEPNELYNEESLNNLSTSIGDIDQCSEDNKRMKNPVIEVKVNGNYQEFCKETNTDEKTFQCEHCPYYSNIKINLVQHLRRHTGEKSFSCRYCDYKCAVKAGLTVHERKHTGEKPIVCNICDYRCSRDGDLARHKRIHTGEKPYTCDYCVFKCSQKSNLVTHIRKHTGEKPFKCLFCQYETGDKSAFNKHVKFTHKSSINSK